MSKEEKYTRENPGSFEDKIDTAMADLEMEPEEEFYGADFYAEEDEEQEDYPEEYPEEEEYDSDDDLSDKFSRDIMTDATKELQVELIQPHSRNRRKRSGTVGNVDLHGANVDVRIEDGESDPKKPNTQGSKEQRKKAQETKIREFRPKESESQEPRSPEGESQESGLGNSRSQESELEGSNSQKSGKKELRNQKLDNPERKKQEDQGYGKQKERNQKSKSPKPQSRSARPNKISYVPISDEELDEKIVPVTRKKHKGLKITGLVAAILAVTAGCAYGAVSYYYSDRFFEGTYINGINCSNKTAYEVEQEIASSVENYSIEVTARNQEPQSISGSQINYRYMSDGEVLNLLKQQKPYEWVRGFMETRSYTTAENVTFDKSLLQTEVKALSCAQPENQVEPENAYVALDGSEFTIVPETEGSKLKVKEAYKVLDAAIAGSQTSIDLNSTPDVYAVAAVTSDDPTLLATKDAYNNYTKASITYTFGDQTVTLDGSTLKDWLQFDDKGQLVQDDASFTQHIKDFVAQLASEHDTVGTTRSFNTTSGRTVSVYGSAYGWKINQDSEVAQLTEEIRTGTQITREPVYSMRANAYGYNDIGSTYIEVDMTNQHMYYYQNGSIIFDSDIVSGDIRYEDRATPPGIFTLYYKKSPDVLRGEKKPDGTYEYETPVTYWMPFNGGIGFHDATWQDYFGGDRYTYAGSHGCINMPLDAAATLYSIIDTNVPIVCFY